MNEKIEQILKQGEGINIEFKECKNKIIGISMNPYVHF